MNPLDTTPPPEEAVIKVLRDRGHNSYDVLIFCPYCKIIHYLTDTLLSGTTARPTAASSSVVREVPKHPFCHIWIRSYTGKEPIAENYDGRRPRTLKLPTVSKWPELLKKMKVPAEAK